VGAGAGGLMVRDLLRRLRTVALGAAEDGAVLEDSPPPLCDRADLGPSSSDGAGVVAVLLIGPNLSVTLHNISSNLAALCPIRCNSNLISTLNSAMDASTNCNSGAGSVATAGVTGVVVTGGGIGVVGAGSHNLCSLLRNIPLSLLSAFLSEVRDTTLLSSTSTISSIVSCCLVDL
jgi:hypothetical protein